MIVENVLGLVAVGILYFIFRAWLGSIKPEPNDTAEEGAARYSVTLPPALKHAYTGAFVFGSCLAILFSYLYANHQAGATIGHVVFASVFAAIGLIVMLICMRWRIDVDGDKFTVHYCFGSKKTFEFQDVDRVEVGAKDELVIYVGGKPVGTIDRLATNRKAMERSLESRGKLG